METPIRILHVVGGMNRAGTETWLMNVLRHIDRDQFHMEFLVHSEKPGDYDEEIEQLGSKVIPCLHPSRPWAYARNFRRILGIHGPYDVLHSHVHHFSGLTLALAQRAGVPVRIAHSHSDTSEIQASSDLVRKQYYRLSKALIRKYSTHRLAGSIKAGDALFRVNLNDNQRYQILQYGIDLEPYRQPTNNALVRDSLGISRDAFVIGHIGRFVSVKNQGFILAILSEALKIDPRTHVLFVGDGPLRSEIERQVDVDKLHDNVTFAGVRSDIANILMGAIDCFLLPSFYEGFPVTAIEAQAARVPVVVSDAVTPEVSIIPEAVQHISLAKPPDYWAKAIIGTSSGPHEWRSSALGLLADGPFNVTSAISELRSIYARQ